MSQTIIGAIAGILAVGVPTIVGLLIKGLSSAQAKVDASHLSSSHELVKQSVDLMAQSLGALIQKVGPIVQADLAAGNLAKVGPDALAQAQAQLAAQLAAASAAVPK